VAEHLPGKHNALSSSPVPTTKEEEEIKKKT
jgi:hypothetical protein